MGLFLQPNSIGRCRKLGAAMAASTDRRAAIDHHGLAGHEVAGGGA